MVKSVLYTLFSLNCFVPISRGKNYGQFHLYVSRNSLYMYIQINHNIPETVCAVLNIKFIKIICAHIVTHIFVYIIIYDYICYIAIFLIVK